MVFDDFDDFGRFLRVIFEVILIVGLIYVISSRSGFG